MEKVESWKTAIFARFGRNIFRTSTYKFSTGVIHIKPYMQSLLLFTVRRYALHGLSYRNSVRPSVRPSVCPSVCHTRALRPHGSTYDHDFFTVW